MIEILPPDYQSGGFDCGKKDLNDFLNDGTAVREAAASFSVTYLVWRGEVLAGYFSLLHDAIRLEASEKPDGIIYASAPGLKVGRIAVCTPEQGTGIGTTLLEYIVGIARLQAQDSGCRYVTLDAQEDVVGWYERFGFRVNQAENKVAKFARSLTSKTPLERLLKKPPRNTSMRYDIQLQEEGPEVGTSATV